MEIRKQNISTARTAQTSDALQEELRLDSNTKWRTECVTPKIGAGEIPDDTMLTCARGSDSALEFLSTCKLANLTVKAELGCCLLHRSGRLTIDGCVLQCESNPLDFLSCPIVSTANSSEVVPSHIKSNSGNGVFVSQTRIEGGAKAVLTSGDLVLQRVRVVYARTSLLFWFDVEQM
ncbi:F-box protein SKIP5 [Trifolium pratense]|uniref:F-box protein SKIP5 n=1 Tax=Trifolium pratense TaxID=57577 RepID=A0A2K3MWH1_TRIPR|nr:F-box protein SKIP5 [Trifolium pratense]